MKSKPEKCVPKNTILKYTKTSIAVYMGMPYNVTEYKVILAEKVLENTFSGFDFIDLEQSYRDFRTFKVSH